MTSLKESFKAEKFAREALEALRRRVASQEEIEAAEAQVTTAVQRKTETVLCVTSKAKDDAIDGIKECLGSLSAKIASLVTADIVQCRLLGEEAFDDLQQTGVHASGRALAAEFLNSIPPRLRPVSLYTGLVEDQALWFAECTDSVSVSGQEHHRVSEALVD